MAFGSGTMRGLTRYASRVGHALPRLVIWPQDTTPRDAPIHWRPITQPSGTAAEGDLYWDATANAPAFYNGSAWVTIADLAGATAFTDVTVTDDLAVGDDATITGDLAVTGTSALAGAVNYKQQVTDTGGAYATPIVLTEAQSGRTILVDDAAGLDFTLPALAAAQIGTFYKFIVTVTITSNNLRVTAATGDLLRGGVAVVDFDTANTLAYFTPDESDDLIYTANGSTKGGKKGSVVTFTAISATGWFVEGLTFGDGSLATPFA